MYILFSEKYNNIHSVFLTKPIEGCGDGDVIFVISYDKIVKQQRGKEKGGGGGRGLVHGQRGMFDCKRREVFKTLYST